MKVNFQFWKTRAGDPSLGNQDAEVFALRKMGYTGTLNDMRRAFYKDITGIDDLTTAKARANDVPDYAGTLNFVGKTNGDGNTNKIAKYGAASVLLVPSGFTSEFVSGYGKCATDNDDPAYYLINTPNGAYPQLCFNLSLNTYGTRATMVKMLKSLRVRVKTRFAKVYVWDGYGGAYISSKTVAVPTTPAWTYVDIDLTDVINTAIDSSNFVRVLVTSHDPTTGLDVKAEVDYIEVLPTFFKQLP